MWDPPSPWPKQISQKDDITLQHIAKMSKIGEKFAFIWGKMGSKCKILFSGPSKGTSLRETASFDVLIVKIGAGVFAVCRKNQKN